MADNWLADDQHSALTTAQILADFQHNDALQRPHPPHPHPSQQQQQQQQMPLLSTCSDDSCRAQAAVGCVEECEMPFTADCTDGCIVVCEEAADGFFCEPQTVCQSSDCQYSSLDQRCCMGCSASDDLVKDSCDFFAHPGYGQHQAFDGSFHHGMPAYHDDHSSFSHCTLPCSVSSYDPYYLTPSSSMAQSSSGSPWSLQSPATSIRGSQSYQASGFDGDSRYGMPTPSAADGGKMYQNAQLARNFFGSYGNFDQSSSAQSAELDSAMDAQAKPHFNQSFAKGAVLDSDSSKGSPALQYGSGSADGFSELQCRWIVTTESGQHMCQGSFASRDALHQHILEEHVKTMKKRGSTAAAAAAAAAARAGGTVHPICCWHGCESAKKKKVFKLQHLKDHIVCHSKLRMRCSVCGKECRDAKVLKIHMNSHRPGQEKPFRCDVDGCTASFGTSALLSSHKRVHTGEKPHKCTWCDYRAADKGNLRRHEEEMHMGKKWPCPYCSQQLAKKANLTRHIRDLHATEDLRRQAISTMADGT